MKEKQRKNTERPVEKPEKPGHDPKDPTMDEHK